MQRKTMEGYYPFLGGVSLKRRTAVRLFNGRASLPAIRRFCPIDYVELSVSKFLILMLFGL